MNRKIHKAVEFSAKVLRAGTWAGLSAFTAPPRLKTLRENHEAGEPFTEFVRTTREPAFIEPEFGYVYTESGKFVRDSLDHSVGTVAANWRLASVSPLKVWGYRKRATQARRYKTVISLRHFWEWNYYHFYFDVLGKLSLLDMVGVPHDVPLVLGGYVDELRWARQILAQGKLASRNWIVEEGPVFADEVMYCCTLQPYRLKLDYLMDQMGAASSADFRDDLVFVGRSKGSTRLLLNQPEVVDCLREFGFRIHESLDGLAVAEQAEIFRNARVIVIVHGAAVTNCVYRRNKPMTLFELHAESYISTDFRRMSQEYGRQYLTLGGAPTGGQPQWASFRIDVSRLRQMLIGQVGLTPGCRLR